MDLQNVTEGQLESSEEKPSAPLGQETEQPKVVCGYTIALTEKQGIVFQLVGETPELLNLLGLHRIATLKVEGLLEENQRTGDALVRQVASSAMQIAQEVGRLTASVQPFIPSNSLKKNI